jgi:hypothetical protein
MKILNKRGERGHCCFKPRFTESQSVPISIKTDKISQQPENCENRKDPDLVQAFLKKWWVESDFKAPNLPLSLRLKVSGCHYNSENMQGYNQFLP